MKIVKSIVTVASVALLVNSAEATSKQTKKVGLSCSKNSDCPENSICKHSSCACRPGYSGQNCHLTEPLVKCLPDRIEVHISKTWAKTKANVDSFEQIYLGSNADDSNCQSFPHPENSETFILRVSEDATCGTKVSRNATTSDYVYSNEVLSSALTSSSEDIDINISRIPTISLVSWQCVYKARYDVSYTDPQEKVAAIKVIDKVQLPNKSEIKIRSFSDDSYLTSQTATLYDGDDIYLELKNSKNIAFDVDRCSIRMAQGEEKGTKDIAEVFGLKMCRNSDYITELFPNTRVLENTNRDLKIAYTVNRDDFTSVDGSSLSEDEDPQVFIHCEVTQEEVEAEACAAGKASTKAAKNINRRAAGKEAGQKFIIENGPFTIKPAQEKLLNNLNGPISSRTPSSASSDSDSSEINNINNENSEDEEHSLPDTEAISELISALGRVKDSVNKADAVQLEAVLQHLQRASEEIKPLIELTSEYSLTEFDTPGPIYRQLGSDGDYISVNDVSDEEEERARATRRMRTMVVLAISIGVIFICLIALPVLFVFYRNNVAGKVIKDSEDSEKGGSNSANETPSKFEQQPHQIITMDTGLNVDHALHFVEYTDHIHDLVFETEDNEQYPTNMWIKQISTDTQSIDISNQDPIKMTYTNSLYTKNAHNPNNNNIICSQDIHRTSSNSSSKSSINSFSMATAKKELPVPSYVTMQNSANSNIKRKKSFRLAGVKIPTEIINTIMPHSKTSKPYKTNNNNNIVSEANCRGTTNPVFE